MTEFLASLKDIPSWAGNVPNWIMAISFLGILWKGLPAVLEAWSNSVAKERAHRESEIKRLEGQIKAGDDRHTECMEGQRKLREEMDDMRKDHTIEIEAMRRTHSEEVSGLRDIISGLMMQMRQLQISTAERTGEGLSPAITSMLGKLDKIGSKQ